MDGALSDDNESLWAFLERRERQLENRLENALSAISALEADLVEVRRAKEAVRPPTDGHLGLSHLLRKDVERAMIIDGAEGISGVLPENFLTQFSSESGVKWSIKQLILKALLSMRFRRDGATANEIRDFIKDVDQRDIERTSLSPQLSRLYKDGLIYNKAANDLYAAKWAITEKALGIQSPELLNDESVVSDELDRHAEVTEKLLSLQSDPETKARRESLKRAFERHLHKDNAQKSDLSKK